MAVAQLTGFPGFQPLLFALGKGRDSRQGGPQGLPDALSIVGSPPRPGQHSGWLLVTLLPQEMAGWSPDPS